MARFDNKVKISNELDHSKIDLSLTHITTTDFNVIKPIYCDELVPGDKLSNFHVQNFTRLLPLNCPTFGRVDMVTRAFFCPYRLIEPDFNDVYNQQNTSTSSGLLLKRKVDNFNLGQLAECFVSCMDNLQLVSRYGKIELYTLATGDDAYDFTFPDRQAAPTKAKLTPTGKRVFDILLSLGYVFNLSNFTDATPVNYFALRAWVRIFYDWYLPSQYSDKYRRAFEPHLCSLEELIIMLAHMCYRYYNDDVFSATLNQPFLRGESARPAVDRIVQSNNNNGVLETTFAVNPSTGSGSVASTSTQGLSLEYMTAMMHFVQRHNLLTHRMSDLFKAKFGIASNDVRDDITEYLGKTESPVQISDVMATGENVGDYAGKGISADETGFHYSSDEFGLFIVINEVVPKVGYSSSLKPHVQRVSPYDFFQPEWDGIGFEPVTVGNVNKYITKDVPTYPNENTVFGFLPRYALGYKSALDICSGDFKVPSLRTGLNSFHMLREFSADLNYNPPIYNDESFRYTGYQNNDDNFDRIFVNTDRSADHFLSIFAFDIEIVRPMLAISESWMVNSDGKENRGNIVENGGSLS